jgi:hypothetical protein
MRNRLLAFVFAVVAAMGLSTFPAHAAHAPLKLGTINPKAIVQLPSCPAGYIAGMTCFRGTVEKCPNAADLGFIYGYENPVGRLAGTVVFHDGGGGTAPYADPTYAEKYLHFGYQVIFLAWDTDWEGSTNGLTGTSIKNAACRPATLFNYFYQNLYTQGGMCAQGFSAGSGAVAYSLAWYGSASYLDNVELLSGPPFGDIDQGCEVPNSPIVTVCATGQFGCNGPPWQDSPAYVSGDEELVGPWSGWNVCNEGRPTSIFAKSAWKAMSIVDGTTDPSFSYPQTAMAGYLCSNVNTVQNNTAAEGNFFYLQFTSALQTAQFSVTRIDHCSGPEGVTKGRTPQGANGFDAISTSMISACIKRH